MYAVHCHLLDHTVTYHTSMLDRTHTYHTNRGDYNSLTSDIFRSFWLNVRPLIHYLSNAMYGCPTKLSKFMVIDDFWPIISATL